MRQYKLQEAINFIKASRSTPIVAILSKGPSGDSDAEIPFPVAITTVQSAHKGRSVALASHARFFEQASNIDTTTLDISPPQV
jgi:hypothetical protein